LRGGLGALWVAARWRRRSVRSATSRSAGDVAGSAADGWSAIVGGGSLSGELAGMVPS
jgi:hypothetical protein